MLTSQTKAVLSYVFGFISGIIFIGIEKDDEFVRLCAGQSVVFSSFCVVLILILSPIAVVGPLLSSFVSFVFFVAWIFLIIKANQNIYLKLPFFSYVSEKYLLKF